jgi:hypothetical protein
MVGVTCTEIEFGDANGRKEDVASIQTVYLLLNLGKTIRKPVDHNIGIE